MKRTYNLKGNFIIIIDRVEDYSRLVDKRRIRSRNYELPFVLEFPD